MATQQSRSARPSTMGLRQAMERDPKVLIMGEDVGKLGGVFRVTDGLQKDFGEDRVVDTPLAESAILGTAIGLALRGYRPVCEIQFDGFVYPAFDQIVSQVAKMHYRSQGKLRDAGRRPHPVRRRHRRGRAPQRVARGLLRAHRRAEGRRVLQPGRRVLDDPAGDRLRRPGDLLRAEAPLLGEGRGRRVRPRAATRCACAGGPRGHRRDARGVRPDGEDRAGGGRPPRRRAGRSRSSTCGRSRRWTCDTVAASVEKTGRLVVVHEAPVRSGWAPRSPRGSPSAASTSSRRRCCASAGSTPPTRRRGSRRSTCPTSTGCSTPSTAPRVWRTDGHVEAVQAPRRRRGPHRGRDPRRGASSRATRSRSTRSIVEIETAKAVVELPSPFAGVVTELLIDEGETVDVGAPIITIETEAGGTAVPAEAAEASSDEPRSATRRRGRRGPPRGPGRLRPATVEPSRDRRAGAGRPRGQRRAAPAAPRPRLPAPPRRPATCRAAAHAGLPHSPTSGGRSRGGRSAGQAARAQAGPRTRHRPGTVTAPGRAGSSPAPTSRPAAAPAAPAPRGDAGRRAAAARPARRSRACAR